VKNKLNDIITIKDVAKKSGYSISAVSMALSRKGRISETTSQKILNAANELGYRPNKTAQSLSHKIIKIGVLIPRDPIVIQSILSKGIHCALEAYRDTKIKLILCESGPDLAERKHYLELLCGEADGIIIEDDLFEPEFSDCIKKLNARGCPVVSLVSGAPPLLRLSGCVSTNAEIVGKLAAQFLHIKNCTGTVIFSGIEHADIHRRNRNGFLEAAKLYKMHLHEVFYTDDIPEKAYNFAKQLINKSYPIDGIFVSSYLAPAVCAGLSEAGINTKISVIGVDLYHEIADCLRNEQLCATIYQNQFAQAYAAVDCILNFIFNKRQCSKKQDAVFIKPELVLSENLDCYQEYL